MKNPQTILITGASSGLGAALAVYYARRGATLFLQGRHQSRLSQTHALCEELGAIVHSASLDVTDAVAMQQWIAACVAIAPVDLAIANAGISAGTGDGGESAQQIASIFATNISGVINTLQPLVPYMSSRGKGQLAIISSLAGMRGLASSPAYSASKACVRVYGEGLRGLLAPLGVEVSVVCPGFIKTPMTDVNQYYMPFLMSADKAAAIIARGLEKNIPRLAFPLRLYIPLWFLSCLSPRLTDRLFALLPKKPGAKQA